MVQAALPQHLATLAVAALAAHPTRPVQVVTTHLPIKQRLIPLDQVTQAVIHPDSLLNFCLVGVLAVTVLHQAQQAAQVEAAAQPMHLPVEKQVTAAGTVAAAVQCFPTLDQVAMEDLAAVAVVPLVSTAWLVVAVKAAKVLSSWSGKERT